MRKSAAYRVRFWVTKCHDLPRPAGQPLLPRCYQNTPYQEHPGAQSLTPNPRVFVRIGPLGSAQVGPRKNYESVGRGVRISTSGKDSRASNAGATPPFLRDTLVQLCSQEPVDAAGID